MPLKKLDRYPRIHHHDLVLEGQDKVQVHFLYLAEIADQLGQALDDFNHLGLIHALAAPHTLQ
jgi:hypothetical protein